MIGSWTLQITLAVGTALNGSTNSVSASGIRTISLSWIFWNPLILEPSNPIPSRSADSVMRFAGTEKCCHVPNKSTNFKSTCSTPSSPSSPISRFCAEAVAGSSVRVPSDALSIIVVNCPSGCLAVPK